MSLVYFGRLIFSEVILTIIDIQNIDAIKKEKYYKQFIDSIKCYNQQFLIIAQDSLDFCEYQKKETLEKVFFLFTFIKNKKKHFPWKIKYIQLYKINRKNSNGIKIFFYFKFFNWFLKLIFHRKIYFFN